MRRPTDAALRRSFRDNEIKALLEMRGVHGAEMSWVRDGAEGDEVRWVLRACFQPRHRLAAGKAVRPRPGGHACRHLALTVGVCTDCLHGD